MQLSLQSHDFFQAFCSSQNLNFRLLRQAVPHSDFFLKIRCLYRLNMSFNSPFFFNAVIK